MITQTWGVKSGYMYLRMTGDIPLKETTNKRQGVTEGGRMHSAISYQSVISPIPLTSGTAADLGDPPPRGATLNTFSTGAGERRLANLRTSEVDREEISVRTRLDRMGNLP